MYPFLKFFLSVLKILVLVKHFFIENIKKVLDKQNKTMYYVFHNLMKQENIHE